MDKALQILDQVLAWQKEAEDLREQAEALEEKAQDLLEEQFGVRDGELLNTELLLRTIIKTIQKDSNG